MHLVSGTPTLTQLPFPGVFYFCAGWRATKQVHANPRRMGNSRFFLFLVLRHSAMVGVPLCRVRFFPVFWDSAIV